MACRISNRKLADIPDMVLPCVLLLKERRACILLSVADGYASVVFPETGEGTDRIPLENLKELYAGYAILTRPNFKYRVEKDERLMDRKGSWFWGINSLRRQKRAHHGQRIYWMSSLLGSRLRPVIID